MPNKAWRDFIHMSAEKQCDLIDTLRSGGFSDVDIKKMFHVSRSTWERWARENGMARKTCDYEVFKKSDTLCWDCEKACGSCSWSRELTPVEGWEVTETGDPTYLLSLRKIVPTVSVISCPKFKRG